MQPRRVLIALVGAAAVAVTAVLAWPGPQSAPVPTPPETMDAADADPPLEVDSRAEATDPLDDELPATVRTAVTPGNGWLCVQAGFGMLKAGGPASTSEPGWLALRAVPVRGTGDHHAVDLEWIDGRQLGAELPSGTWRIQCVRGPGDPPGADPSPGWIVDPDDDLGVPAGSTTKATVRIVRSVDPPDPGRATIVGTAFVDGAPATEHVVRLAPFADMSVARVEGDGTFRLDDVPAGWRDLELWSRTDGGPMRYARTAIAPRDGEVLRVDLRARTTRVEGLVVDVDGNPVAGARVELWGEEYLLVGGQAERPQRFTRTDSAGRFAIGPIPSGRYSVRASDSDGLAPHVAIEARPDGASRLRLVRRPWVRVHGVVELPDGAEAIPRGRLELLLSGPVDRRIRCRNRVFDTSRLVEGTYRARVLSTRGWLDADARLVVPAGGLEDTRITLRRRR